MKERTLEDILKEMLPEQYTLIVGKYSNEPLKNAFCKKREGHPRQKGSTLLTRDCEITWKYLMQQSANKSRKRTAYVHIPFCSHMCLYCGFFQNYSQEERETQYIDHLICDLESSQKDTYIQSGLFQAVFLGGGTPSTLSPYNIARLLHAIRKYLPLSNDCEVTLEGRVHDLIEEKIEAWFNGGVNRLSIGVQSFNTKIRQMVGRIDSREIVLERLHKVASYNQASIVVDLLFGLPGQTITHLIDDLITIDSLPIDGMDLYQLNVYEISPLRKAIDAGKIPRAATVKEQADMFAMAHTWLNAAVYKRLSACHWGKNSRERNLYNILSKEGAEVVPFGAGAGGKMSGYSVFLQRDLKLYMEKIAAGEKPLQSMMRKSEYRALHIDIVRQIEQSYLNLSFLMAKYGDRLCQLEYLLKIWQKHGLIIYGKTLSRLTVAGQFWHRNLMQSLIDCVELILNEKVNVEQIMRHG
ncbi:MAG: putative heme utilization radical enzyme HutW [Firmicutes bacterium]|nr:putative heme utilization radical enzyme HutW [Bacillota bacterium]